MQQDLEQTGLRLGVQILGVNQRGLEAGNARMCDGRDLPWLQEASDQDVWGDWQVTYRDVVILDAENQRAAVYNLTVHDLNVAANYDSLESLILQIAGGGAPIR
jgi:hypothetical protein